MKSLEVSRRRMMALLGASVALAPAAAIAAPSPLLEGPAAAPSDRDIDGSALLAPLAAGSQLASWQLVRVSAVRHGAVTVGMREGTGAEFYLDICSRDMAAGAPVPPGRSDRFDVFVANLGDGSRPTDESHGLAAMAVAEVLRTNEHRVSIPGLLTLRERLATYSDKVLRGF